MAIKQAPPPIRTIDRIIRVNELCALVGLHRSTVWRAVAQGKFPKPVVISTQSRGWRASDIEQWIASRQPAKTSAEQQS
jgi:prophage regulatory protein